MARPVTFFQRWVKPDVYPLIGAMGAGLGFMVYTSARTIFAPDVFLNKELRTDNNGEMCDDRSGHKYKHSPLREYVRTVYDVDSTEGPHVPARR